MLVFVPLSCRAILFVSIPQFLPYLYCMLMKWLYPVCNVKMSDIPAVVVQIYMLLLFAYVCKFGHYEVATSSNLCLLFASFDLN